MPDDPDIIPFDPHRRKIGIDIGGPGEPGEPGSCEFDGHFYPNGSVIMIEGRPATCTQGKWLGVGDDPPFNHRRPDFLDDSDTRPD